MPTNNLLVLKKASLGLAIVWTLLIAVLCLIKASALPSIGVSIPHIDKYVHFTFHFVFSVLWVYYFWQQQRKLEVKNMLTVIVISIFYGVAIEIAQELFTTTRHADIMDVAANFTGAMLAFILFLFIKKKKAREAASR